MQSRAVHAPPAPVLVLLGPTLLADVVLLLLLPPSVVSVPFIPVLPIRIAALLALVRLRHLIEFSEAQLTVVISLLEDVSCRLRSAVHAVLGSIPLTRCLYRGSLP